MSSFAYVGGGSAENKGKQEKTTREEINNSRDICKKQYEAGLELAKQKRISDWRDAADEGESEDDFVKQLNRAAATGKTEEGDDKMVKLYK